MSTHCPNFIYSLSDCLFLDNILTVVAASLLAVAMIVPLYKMYPLMPDIPEKENKR